VVLDICTRLVRRCCVAVAPRRCPTRLPFWLLQFWLVGWVAERGLVDAVAVNTVTVAQLRFAPGFLPLVGCVVTQLACIAGDLLAHAVAQLVTLRLLVRGCYRWFWRLDCCGYGFGLYTLAAPLSLR